MLIELTTVGVQCTKTEYQTEKAALIIFADSYDSVSPRHILLGVVRPFHRKVQSFLIAL